MLPFGNPRFAMLVGLMLVAAPLEARNPHTADGSDCGPWLASAPLSERIRQARSCEGFTTSKAMQLAQEFEAGSNGLPKNWAEAATWYRETLKIAARLPPESLAARRGEAAAQGLAGMLWTGGHGLQANPGEAQRLAPVNIVPGLWEFTSVGSQGGQQQPLVNGGRETICVTADKLATDLPFAMSALVENFRTMGCTLEQVRANALDAEVSVDCQEYYDYDWDEPVGQIAKVSMKFRGEAFDSSFVATRYPDGVQSVVQTTGRRIRAC